MDEEGGDYEKRQSALYGHAGIEYQKLLVIDIALGFFEKNPASPEVFKIKTELANVGALDDVVVELGNAHEIKFYQVKHHYLGTKGDKYTFAALTNTAKKGHKKRVELHHFFDGWLKHIDGKFNNYECILFSNHDAAKNLTECFDRNGKFSNNFIDDVGLKKGQKLKRTQVFESIKGSVTGATDDLIKKFLKVFKFSLNEPERQEYEGQLRNRFKRLLKSDSDHDFAVLKKYTDDNFFENTAITPETIKKLIERIYFEKSLFWFRHYSKHVLDQIRDVVGDVHIAQDLSVLCLDNKESVTVVTGKSGSGKTVLVKKAFKELGADKCLYFNARELRSFEDKIGVLTYADNLKGRVDVVMVDNVDPSIDWDLLRNVVLLRGSFKVVLVSEVKYVDQVDSWLKSNRCENTSLYHLRLLTDLVLNQREFCRVVERIPKKLRSKLTPFILDKLVQLDDGNADLFDQKYGLNVELLDLWFLRKFGEDREQVIVLLMKVVYRILMTGKADVEKELDQNLLSRLCDSSVLWCSEQGVKFSHDHYFHYAAYKYFENVYRSHFVIEGEIDIFLSRCIKTPASHLFFIKHFHAFSSQLPPQLSKEFRTYLRELIPEAVRYDHAVLVVWCLQKLGISPLKEIDVRGFWPRLDYVMYAIQEQAEKVLVSILQLIDEPLLERKESGVEVIYDSDEGQDSSDNEIYTEETNNAKYDSVSKYCWDEMRINRQLEDDPTESLGFRSMKVLKVESSICSAHESLRDNALLYVNRAAEIGNPAIICALLGHNTGYANKTPTNRYKETPLHVAVLHATFEGVKFFVAAGFSVNACDRDSETPLHNAIYELDLFKALYLLLNGADLNALNIALLSPLHLAVLMGFGCTKKSAMFVALLRYFGADVTLDDNEGCVPFDMLVKINCLDEDLVAAMSDQELDSVEAIEEFISYEVEHEDFDNNSKDDFERSTGDKLACVVFVLLRCEKKDLGKVIGVYLNLLQELEPQHSKKYREFFSAIFYLEKVKLKSFLDRLTDEDIRKLEIVQTGRFWADSDASEEVVDAIAEAKVSSKTPRVFH